MKTIPLKRRRYFYSWVLFQTSVTVCLSRNTELVHSGATMLRCQLFRKMLLAVFVLSQALWIYLISPRFFVLHSGSSLEVPKHYSYVNERCNFSDTFISNFFSEEVNRRLYSKVLLDLQVYMDTERWLGVQKTEILDDMTFYAAYNRYRLKLPILRNVTGIIPQFGPVINDVFSTRFPMNHQELCSNFTDEKLGVVFLVNSASSNFERRTVARKSWIKTMLKNPTVEAKILFYVGSPKDPSIGDFVRDEDKEYGDIIQVNLPDDYSELTSKSVALLHWVNEFCPRARYIVKLDDDVYVNVKNFNAVVKQLKETNYLYGKAITNDKPHRDRKNKYYVSSKLWPWKTYPTYLLGGVYILGQQTILPLLGAAQTTPFFPLEDVYLTGICAERANMTRLSADRLYELNYPTVLDACFVRHTIMWQTRSPSHMIRSHLAVNDVYKQKKKCKKCNVLGVCTN